MVRHPRSRRNRCVDTFCVFPQVLTYSIEARSMTGGLTINATRVRRLSVYVRRHGVLCTLVNIAARQTGHPERQSWPLWRLAGPLLTRREIQRWHETPAPRPILNLGGGSNRMPGTLTVDLDPMSDAYLDVRRRLPFESRTARAIFLEEVIEHIPLDAGRQLLAECYRVLEPGGVLRVTTPDPEWFFTSGDCDALNDIFYNHSHRYLYSRAKLREESIAAGFDYRLSAYREPGSHLGHLDTHPARFGHSPDISQYVELTRPDTARADVVRS